MVGCLKYLSTGKWSIRKNLKSNLSQKKENVVLHQHQLVGVFLLN